MVASHAIGCGTFSYLRLAERVVHRYSILHVLVMCGCSAGWRERQQREQEGEADTQAWLVAQRASRRPTPRRILPIEGLCDIRAHEADVGRTERQSMLGWPAGEAI